jgi:hypothetical protein
MNLIEFQERLETMLAQSAGKDRGALGKLLEEAERGAREKTSAEDLVGSLDRLLGHSWFDDSALHAEVAGMLAALRETAETREDPLADEPFSYRQTKDGQVMISHSGRVVTTLRGKDAERFLSRAAPADPRALQLLMARVTGQFKFGNERQGKSKKRGG